MPLICYCASPSLRLWGETAHTEFCLMKEGLLIFMGDYTMAQTNGEA